MIMMSLGKREKVLVSLAALGILVFLLLHFAVFPFFDRRDLLKRGIEAKRDSLIEMIRLRREYESSKRGAEGVRKYLRMRKKGFTLFSFLERAAGRAGVKDHIKYMKPSVSEREDRLKEAMVEMKLDGISLKQMVNYLYLIESPRDVVSVKRISIKDSKGSPGYLDAVVQVITVVES